MLKSENLPIKSKNTNREKKEDYNTSEQKDDSFSSVDKQNIEENQIENIINDEFSGISATKILRN